MDDNWLRAYDESGQRGHDEKFGGKWMPHFAWKRMDDTWATIDRAIRKGQLGGSAKRPIEPPSPGRATEILVFTADYRDEEDVLRVLRSLRELGFWKAAISYKEDAATRAEARLGYFKYGALYVAPAGEVRIEQRRDPVID